MNWNLQHFHTCLQPPFKQKKQNCSILSIKKTIATHIHVQQFEYVHILNQSPIQINQSFNNIEITLRPTKCLHTQQRDNPWMWQTDSWCKGREGEGEGGEGRWSCVASTFPCIFGSIQVSGKLPTYPSPKPSFCPKCECQLRGRVGGIPKLIPFFCVWQYLKDITFLDEAMLG